jgi:hypothetical protein
MSVAGVDCRRRLRFRALLHAILDTAGYDVQQAANGAAAPPARPAMIRITSISYHGQPDAQAGRTPDNSESGGGGRPPGGSAGIAPMRDKKDNTRGSRHARSRDRASCRSPATHSDLRRDLCRARRVRRNRGPVLTEAQAPRLWGLDPALCGRVLTTLVDAEFVKCERRIHRRVERS